MQTPAGVTVIVLTYVCSKDSPLWMLEDMLGC